MSKKIKKLLNNKYFIVALVALLIVLVIGTGTYAWLTWSSPNTTKLTVKIGNIADVIFDNGKEINTTSLAPVFTYDQGEKTSFSIVKRSTATSANIDYTITLNITSIAAELKVASFKYVLLNGNQVVRQGDFSSASSGGTISLNSSTLTDTRADFTFYIYIDGNTENNANMMNKEFKATINVSASEGSSGPTMAQYILDLYNNNKDSTMTNYNSNTAYSIASTKSLMNDRLGGTTEDLDGGNLRYYGEYPENYIYFNCSTYPDDSPENNCELWRIIGVFDGKLKIVRNEYINDTPMQMYTSDAGGISSPEEIYWKNSSVAKIFNPWSPTGCSNYWNTESDSTQNCEIYSIPGYDNFMSIITMNTLKNDETRNMIAAYPNYLFLKKAFFNGSLENQSVEVLHKYIVENLDTTANDIYVGILSALDYGYTADFINTCGNGIFSLSDYGDCGKQAWLYNSGSDFEFLINVEAGEALALDRTDGNIVETSVISEGYFRPVVYLDSNVKFVGGSGTEDDPYMISP